jgi:hypothetical protein
MTNIEKELIQILITKSNKIGKLLYYTDLEDIERNLKQNNIFYDKKDLENIDITYINIKGEDEYRLTNR